MESETDTLANEGSVDENTQFVPFTLVVTVHVTTRTLLGALWQRYKLVQSLVEFLDGTSIVRADIAPQLIVKERRDSGAIYGLTLFVYAMAGSGKAVMPFIENGVNVVVVKFKDEHRRVIDTDVIRKEPHPIEPELTLALVVRQMSEQQPSLMEGGDSPQAIPA